MARFYTTEKISENREKTPEGFLLCIATPIARTGVQIYTAEEMPEGIEPDENGLVMVERPEDEVFHPDSIASFEGKAFTLDHPEEDVTPANWRELAHGHVQNVRRGEGDKADLLVGDLLVMTAEAIKDVEAGKVELSNGYDAEYQPDGKGKAVQRNIKGNHVALVDAGRCGWRCSIGDSNTMRQVPMQKNDSVAKRALDTALALLKFAKDEEPDTEQKPAPAPAPEQNPTPAPEGAAQDNPIEGKIDQLIAAVTALAEAMKGGSAPAATDQQPEKETTDKGDPEENKGEAPTKTGDKARTMDAQELRARADILVPGHSFDCKKSCDTMRNALAAAYPVHKDTINAFTRGTSDFKTMDCVTLEAAFIGSSEVLKTRNNHDSANAATNRATNKDGARVMDNAALNKQNADFWNKRQGGSKE